MEREVSEQFEVKTVVSGDANSGRHGVQEEGNGDKCREVESVGSGM